jgi:hypothetical protein
MEAVGLDQLSNLGVAGFAILVLWWMYQSSSSRLDKAYDDHKALEREVRDKIISQLERNTNAFERIMAHITKI